MQSVSAQDDFSIPDAISNAFRKKYPEVTEVSWIRTDKAYIADFKIEKVIHQVWLSNSGVIQKHSVHMHKQDLPAGVLKTLNTQFVDYKVLGAEKLDIKGKVYYKLRLKGAEARAFHYFNSQGKEVALKE